MQTTKTCPPLTAYRVSLSDGSSYVTSMAAGITLEEARRYFLGQRFEQADEKTILECVGVDPVNRGETPTRDAGSTFRKADRLFVGVYPCGIVYADRSRERNGDYARLAFLPYKELALRFEDDCPADMRADIEADAAKIIARRGQSYQVAACGQTVTLG